MASNRTRSGRPHILKKFIQCIFVEILRLSDCFANADFRNGIMVAITPIVIHLMWPEYPTGHRCAACPGTPAGHLHRQDAVTSVAAAHRWKACSLQPPWIKRLFEDPIMVYKCGNATKISTRNLLVTPDKFWVCRSICWGPVFPKDRYTYIYRSSFVD